MRLHASIFAITICTLATATQAQSEQAPAPACPAQYELVGGTLCIKFANGDIVSSAASDTTVRYTDAHCPAGYGLMFDNQCLSAKTGDVVFVAQTPRSTLASK